MHASFRLSSVLALLTSGLCVGQAHAQHYHYQPQYHIDHHDHVVRDGHGHVLGRYHHDVVHRDATYILPHTAHGSGTYSVHNGQYQYYPQTASVNPHVTYVSRPVTVEFGSFSHVDELATRLESGVNDLCLDLHWNYSHNSGFRETYREAYEILELARFIHAAEHRHDRDAIAVRLKGLDDQFHHIQDDVRGWSRHHHRQVGDLGILTKMDLLESTIHHLMNDVGARLTPASSGPGEKAPPPSVEGLTSAPVPR